MSVNNNKCFVVFLLLLFSFSGVGQNYPKEQQSKLDSFNNIINDASQHDTSIAKAYISLCDLLYNANLDTLIPLSNAAKLIAEKGLKRNSSKAIEKSFSLTLAASYGNFGVVFQRKGDFPNALKNLHKSLKIREKYNEKGGVANSLNNIGAIYDEQGDVEKAIDFYIKSLKIRKEIGDKFGVCNTTYNIAGLYKMQKKNKKALEYYMQSIQMFTDVDYPLGMAYSFISIGGIYFDEGNLFKAREYYDKSLPILEEIDNKRGLAVYYKNIGMIEKRQGNLKEAFKHAEIGMNFSQELGYPDLIEENAKLLSFLYEVKRNYKKALLYRNIEIQMHDSLENVNATKALIEMQTKYEYDKKAAQDSIKQVEETKVLDAQIVAQNAKIKQERSQKVALYGGVILLFLFGGFMFNRFRVTQKQKLVIEKQKLEVVTAFDELEEKNKEIMDSITYAKRIQNAILPPGKLVKNSLPKSFVLYKPKDIVAGDFYWLEHADDKVLFAVADCTGHGVPGAMVSVICNNGLNRSVREHRLVDPGEILDKTRKIVIQEFEKSEEVVKDGMDIALCSLEFKRFLPLIPAVESQREENKECRTVARLKYAGAHNPLWVIRKGEVTADDFNFSEKTKVTYLNNYTLIETKADKQPIGQFDNPSPYTSHSLDLLKGDSIYIFSDGFVDQFGGPRGKKFKSKALKDLLVSIQGCSMEEQGNLLDESFENWRGEVEQIDDVCVIGVEI